MFRTHEPHYDEFNQYNSRGHSQQRVRGRGAGRWASEQHNNSEGTSYKYCLFLRKIFGKMFLTSSIFGLELNKYFSSSWQNISQYFIILYE